MLRRKELNIRNKNRDGHCNVNQKEKFSKYKDTERKIKRVVGSKKNWSKVMQIS